MSILSNLPATPNRLTLVMRFVAERGDRGIGEGELQAWLSPPALQRQATESEERASRGTTLAREVVRELREMALLEPTGEERLRVPEALRDRRLDYRVVFESVLLDPERAETAGQGAFGRALAWFLEQDPAEPFDFGDNVRVLVEDQCGEASGAFELTNKARTDNFFYWARYLGYAWRVDLPNGRGAVLPDPTEAVRRHLATVLAGRGPMHLRDLRQAWATVCPVLEGGVLREEVRDLMRGRRMAPEGDLSRSTSLALRRLDARGVLGLERHADADMVTLATWPQPAPMSHAVWK